MFLVYLLPGKIKQYLFTIKHVSISSADVSHFTRSENLSGNALVLESSSTKDGKIVSFDSFAPEAHAKTYISVPDAPPFSISLPNLSLQDEISFSVAADDCRIGTDFVKQPVLKVLSSPEAMSKKVDYDRLVGVDDVTADTQTSRLLQLTDLDSEPKFTLDSESEQEQYVFESNLLEKRRSTSPKTKSHFLEVPSMTSSSRASLFHSATDISSTPTTPKKQSALQKLSLSFSSLNCSPKRNKASQLVHSKPMHRTCSLKLRKKDRSTPKLCRSSIFTCKITLIIQIQYQLIDLPPVLKILFYLCFVPQPFKFLLDIFWLNFLFL